MFRRGRLSARPRTVLDPAPAGLQPLERDGQLDSYFYVPACYCLAQPSALMVLLHGSGGHAHHGLEVLQLLADESNLILVAPASHDYSWDVVHGRNGPDLAVVNRALEQIFASYAVDPARVAIAGFSDGGSYALQLGLANGDLFTHVVAFSPGFVLIADEVGHPKVFISHGTRDEIQPIFACSRRIIGQLEGMGVEPEYVEFEAGHRIPEDVARQAIAWFMGAPESSLEPLPLRSPESRSPPEG